MFFLYHYYQPQNRIHIYYVIKPSFSYKSQIFYLFFIITCKNCEKAGVKQIRLHDFRHSCASLLIYKGASINMVSKFLGHSKIEETLNTYTHLYSNALSDITNLIDEMNES